MTVWAGEFGIHGDRSGSAQRADTSSQLQRVREPAARPGIQDAVPVPVMERKPSRRLAARVLLVHDGGTRVPVESTGE